MIIVKNFDLKYAGMFYISWGKYTFNANLYFDTLMKMLEIEGYDPYKVNVTLEKLHFSKVELVFIAEMKGEKIESIMVSDTSGDFVHNKLLLIDINLNEPEVVAHLKEVLASRYT